MELLKTILVICIVFNLILDILMNESENDDFDLFEIEVVITIGLFIIGYIMQ